MSNLGLELALETLGIPFLRAKVGDRYVMEQLLAKQWQLGGENSGHIICRDKVTTGDAIIAALQVLAVMVRDSVSLGTLCSGMSLLPQTLVNIRFSGNFDPLTSPQVLSEVAAVERQLAGKGRVVLRKSGTEPLLRIMVEGYCTDIIEQCADVIANTVKRIAHTE